MADRKSVAYGLILMIAAAATAAPERTATAEPAQRQREPAGPGFHVVKLPRTVASTRESMTLLDTPHMLLSSVALPKGGVVDAQTHPTAVTVQALVGSATITVGDAKEPVDLSRMLYIAPGVSHLIEADEREGVVLLIHRVKGAKAPPPRGAPPSPTPMRPR